MHVGGEVLAVTDVAVLAHLCKVLAIYFVGGRMLLSLCTGSFWNAASTWGKRCSDIMLLPCVGCEDVKKKSMIVLHAACLLFSLFDLLPATPRLSLHLFSVAIGVTVLQSVMLSYLLKIPLITLPTLLLASSLRV